MRIRRLIMGALMSLVLVACSQIVSQVSPPATSGPLQPTERPTAAPMPTRAFAVPTELQGTWDTTDSDVAVDLELRISETGYRITTSNPLSSHSGTGRVVVDGDQITFSNSTVCTGIGRYRWLIAGDVLRFEEIGTDECPTRAAVIANVEYRRAE